MEDRLEGRPAWRGLEFAVVSASVATAAFVMLGLAAEQYGPAEIQTLAQAAQPKPVFATVGYSATGSSAEAKLGVDPREAPRP